MRWEGRDGFKMRESWGVREPVNWWWAHSIETEMKLRSRVLAGLGGDEDNLVAERFTRGIASWVRRDAALEAYRNQRKVGKVLGNYLIPSFI